MQITQAQKDLHAFTSPSDIRPILQCVKTDGRVAVATDSFRLVEVTNEDAEPALPEEAAMITAKSLKAAKIKIKDGLADIKRGKKYALTLSNAQETSEAIEGAVKADEFPKYDIVMPKDSEKPIATISFTAEYLEDMAHFFKKHANGGAVKMQIYGENRVAVFTAKANTKINQKIYGLLMPRNR